MTFFPDAEFQRASHRALTPAELRNAHRFRTTLLDPLRMAYGNPIVISLGGFVRTTNVGGGCHGDGRAVDINPQNRDKNDRAFLHRWLAQNRRTFYGENLLETDHIHLTLPGCGGDGETLIQTGKTGDGKRIFVAGYIETLPILFIVGAATLLAMEFFNG